MLIEPASKVSVPFVAVMRMRSRVPDKVIFPAEDPTAVDSRAVLEPITQRLLPIVTIVAIPVRLLAATIVPIIKPVVP